MVKSGSCNTTRVKCENRGRTSSDPRILLRLQRMLLVKEVAALVDILEQSATLEVAAAAFQRAFLRSEHFRVAAAVCVLIEDDLLPAQQRCTALFIVHDLYKSDPPGVHPFIPFLIGLLQSGHALPLHEHNLLCQLLTPNGTQPHSKKTPAELEAAWLTGGERLPFPNLVCARHMPGFLWAAYLIRCDYQACT